MVSNKSLITLTALTFITLTAPAATAQTPPLVRPGEAPPDPMLVTSGPPDRELPEDARLFFDPRVNLLSFVGFMANDSDNNVAFIGGGVGVDVHLRMHRYVSLVLGGGFNGGAELTGSASGGSAYDVGLLVCARSDADFIRGMLGIAFSEVRDRENELDMRAVMANIVVEGGAKQFLGRASLKMGGGWDGIEYRMGFAVSVELSATYTF